MRIQVDSQPKYVALLDILGFKGIITNNSHKEVVELLDNFRVYLQMSLADSKTTIDAKGYHTFDIGKAKINSAIISDSLVFWTSDDKPDSLFDLIDCVWGLISFCHNLPKIFLRGGIACGNFQYDHNPIKVNGIISNHSFIVGKALVDAYSLEQRLEIAGCVISKEVLDTARSHDPEGFNKRLSDYFNKNKLTYYQMPTKYSINFFDLSLMLTKKTKYCTINWVRDTATPSKDEIAKGFSAFGKTLGSRSAKRKLKNTLRYFEDMKRNVFKKAKMSKS